MSGLYKNKRMIFSRGKFKSISFCSSILENPDNCFFAEPISCNPDAKRLYDEILSGYNKLVRPVKNVTDPVTVKVKLKLSQLIDVVRIISLKCFSVYLEEYTFRFTMFSPSFVHQLYPQFWPS